MSLAVAREISFGPSGTENNSDACPERACIVYLLHALSESDTCIIYIGTFR